MQAAQEAEYHVPQTDTDYPVYLTVKVQVKVAFVWVTVWAESCDITDGDTRPHIVKRANDCTELWRVRNMDKQNKRPEWVQLELFPEMKASQGGGAVSNQQK